MQKGCRLEQFKVIQCTKTKSKYKHRAGRLNSPRQTVSKGTGQKFKDHKTGSNPKPRQRYTGKHWNKSWNA